MEYITLRCPNKCEDAVTLTKDQFIINVLDSGQPICAECGDDLEQVELEAL